MDTKDEPPRTAAVYAVGEPGGPWVCGLTVLRLEIVAARMFDVNGSETPKEAKDCQ